MTCAAFISVTDSVFSPEPERFPVQFKEFCRYICFEGSHPRFLGEVEIVREPSEQDNVDRLRGTCLFGKLKAIEGINLRAGCLELLQKIFR